MTVPEDDIEWVTLREAAEATRASLPALRRWYRDGLIRSVVVPGTHGDQRLVDLGEVTARASASPNIGRRSRRSPTPDAVTEALLDQVAAMAMEIDDLRERVAALESGAD
ncbi:MAG: excisionase [Actinobacteria bacterium]|nr:excisionase [Actinomycetota bacterium]